MSEATPTRDPLIEQHEEEKERRGGPGINAQRARRAANLFDLRRMIGGLFVVYGAILIVLGLSASDAEIEKAAGWNLNLSVGIGMLVLGALFLIWAFARPLADELEDAERPEDDRTVRGAPAPTGPDAAALAGSEAASRFTRRDHDRTSG